MTLRFWKRENRQVHEITADAIDLSKPVIIMLPGLDVEYNPTPTESDIAQELTPEALQQKNLSTLQGNLSAYTLRPERFLGGAPTPQQEEYSIVAISYDNKQQSKMNLASSNVAPTTFFSEEAADFTKAVLLPLVAENSNTQKPLADILPKLQNITLLSVSYGSTFAQQVHVAFEKELQKLDFSPDDQKTILKNVLLIAISNVSRGVNPDINKFSAIYFTHKEDGSAKRHMRDFTWRQPACDDGIEVEKLTGNRICVWLKDMEQTIEFLREPSPGNYTAIQKEDADKHMLPWYAEKGKNRQAHVPGIEKFIGIVERAVIHGTCKHGRDDIMTLLEPINPIVSSQGKREIPDGYNDPMESWANRVVLPIAQSADKLAGKRIADYVTAYVERRRATEAAPSR